MLHIKNVVPTFHIIAETKINEEGVRAFFSASKPRFFTSLDEKNKPKISDNEKIVEIAGNICEKIDSTDTANNKEYLKTVVDHFPELCGHTSVTVAFNNVSQTFIDKLHKMHVKMEINQRELGNEELKFWLLPVYADDKELAIKFAELFQSYGTLKAMLEGELIKRKDISILKMIESIKRLLPNTYALDAVVTTNLSVWKNMITNYTELHHDDELRYIMLFLAKTFKHRYPNLFQDIILLENSGNVIGLDSLKTDGIIWRNCKIIQQG